MRLIQSLASTPALDQIFSDESVLAAMLAFEVALARAQSRLGVIPKSAAVAIASVAQARNFDAAAISAGAPRSGTPVIPLVNALRGKVRAKNAAAADFLHYGATSQDVADTALVLLLQRAAPILQADLARLESALTRLAQKHAGSIMLGRTLLQAAPPTTFGLKAAGWLAVIARGRARLLAALHESFILQFGGAAGTLAALGTRGLAVAKALAGELHLLLPEAPWHTHRDRLAIMVCALGTLTGSLGKMARDVSLLAQSEVAEVAEPSAPGRGGSSAMPHKQNPVGCAVALAAAHRLPGLVASFLSCMVQEQERALGGWQAEWPIIADVVQTTGAALAAMAEVAEGLVVKPQKMRANLAAARGAVFAERAVILLGKKLGRERAQHLVEQALRAGAEQERDLAEVLAEMLTGMKEARSALSPGALRELAAPEQYLGLANELRRRSLASAKFQSSPKSPGRKRKD